MNITQTTVLFFYQGAGLVTIKQDARSCTVLRSPNQALVELHEQAGGRENLLIASDVQGSVLNSRTDADKTTVDYTPYGHTHDDGNAILGYTGKKREPTGNYLFGNGYRGYNPASMRFNSPDSYSPFDAGGLNAYAYCMSDPINHSDPSGHIRLRTNSLPPIKPVRTFSQTPTQVSPVPMRRSVSAGNLSTRPDDFASIREPDVRELIFNQLPGKDLGRLSRTSRAFQKEIENLSFHNAEQLHHPHDVKQASLGNWPGVLPKDVTGKRIQHLELLQEIHKVRDVGGASNYLNIRQSALAADRYFQQAGMDEYDQASGRRHAVYIRR